MPLRDDGWFAPLSQEEEFEEFWNIKTHDLYFGWDEKSFIKAYCKLMLFGKSISCCKTMCDTYSSCSQASSEFCKINSAHPKREKYNKTEWYFIYSQIFHRIKHREKHIISVIGTSRYESFMELLSSKALESYSKHTRREQTAYGMNKPKVFESGFVELADMQNDPWQTFMGEKIKKGELQCLQHFSELECLGL